MEHSQGRYLLVKNQLTVLRDIWSAASKRYAWTKKADKIKIMANYNISEFWRKLKFKWHPPLGNKCTIRENCWDKNLRREFCFSSDNIASQKQKASVIISSHILPRQSYNKTPRQQHVQLTALLQRYFIEVHNKIRTPHALCFNKNFFSKNRTTKY